MRVCVSVWLFVLFVDLSETGDLPRINSTPRPLNVGCRQQPPLYPWKGTTLGSICFVPFFCSLAWCLCICIFYCPCVNPHLDSVISCYILLYFNPFFFSNILFWPRQIPPSPFSGIPSPNTVFSCLLGHHCFHSPLPETKQINTTLFSEVTLKLEITAP